jgi:hypothetical protein
VLDGHIAERVGIEKGLLKGLAVVLEVGSPELQQL